MASDAHPSSSKRSSRIVMASDVHPTSSRRASGIAMSHHDTPRKSVVMAAEISANRRHSQIAVSRNVYAQVRANMALESSFAEGTAATKLVRVANLVRQACRKALLMKGATDSFLSLLVDRLEKERLAAELEALEE